MKSVAADLRNVFLEYAPLRVLCCIETHVRRWWRRGGEEERCGLLTATAFLGTHLTEFVSDIFAAV